jgi:glucosylceramidase
VAEEMAAAESAPDQSVLRYVVAGVAGGRRLGAPSPVLEFPLTGEIAPPGHLSFAHDEATLALAWTPGAPLQTYRVYRSDPDGAEDARPLNTTALSSPGFELPVQFGLTQCFTVRAVVLHGAASVESEPAGPVCLTPVDRFAPPAPAGLSGLPTETLIQLLWTPVAAADLAGYLVLRSRDGGPPEPLVAEPVTEPRYTDTPEAGARYTYTVVAVDKAGNRSQPSNEVVETR